MKIYVGNLPFGVAEATLKGLFEGFGEILSVKIIKDKFTGQSRGFGFVEMGNDEEAVKAITDLNGYDLEGKRLRVNEARPPEARPARDRFSGNGSGGGFSRGPRSGGMGGGFGGGRGGNGGGWDR